MRWMNPCLSAIFLCCASDASVTDFVLTTHGEARSWVESCVPPPGAECAQCETSTSTCLDELNSATGLPAFDLACTTVTLPGGCYPQIGSAVCNWDGIAALRLKAWKGTRGVPGGAFAMANFTLLRRASVHRVTLDGSGLPPQVEVLGRGGHSKTLVSMDYGPHFRWTFTPLPLDVTEDGTVNAADLAAILSAWGDLKEDNLADTNLDGRVDAIDLARVLSGWGGDGRE